jgi:uncharacterized protein
MHKMPAGLREFDVNDPTPTCGRWRDNMPKSRDAEAFAIYIKARQLWRSKVQWQLTKDEANAILRDVQKAAAAGDWGARALLAHFYRHGLGVLQKNNVLAPDAVKAVEIARQAAAAGQPWGFYDLGVAHEYGYGGAVLDHKIAWAYYLHAAKLGSPDAQTALADAYGRVRKFNEEATMLQCAFAQEHGPAAYRIAVRERVRKNYLVAARILQQGTEFGSEDCASSLMILFSDGYWTSKEQIDPLNELGLVEDEERSKRYEAFADALKINPDLRFPNLDRVLPLPPAKLPDWEGIEEALGQRSEEAPSY